MKYELVYLFLFFSVFFPGLLNCPCMVYVKNTLIKSHEENGWGKYLIPTTSK